MFRITKNNKTNSEAKELINKTENFWNWYLWVLQHARILDTSYSVKGSYVWLDWGFQLYQKIYSIIQQAYIDSDHLQMQFPSLIKEEIFQKETDFIRNFEDDVYWVDREGTKKLAEGQRLALRPTSELIIYQMFAKWIRSWRDLPLKVFQNVSIFRCETKDTRPLIRNRETIGFIEGHSAYQSKDEAMLNLEQIWITYRNMLDKLGIPFILIEVPNWDRFAGSTKTLDGYVLFPNSKAMELFTTAYLGTTFSEIFNIEFQSESKEVVKAHLLCYGPSIDRILASIISLYGDNRGLRLLPEITPIDMLIVPIFNQKNKEEILTHCDDIKNKLKKWSFNVSIDSTEWTTPGSKFYQAECLGIPIRIEIGKKEVRNNTITFARRDTLSKITHNLNDKSLKTKIKSLLTDISKNLRKEILSKYQTNLIDLTSISSVKKLGSQELKSNRLYFISWCGEKNCAEIIEDTTKFTLLGFMFKSKRSNLTCLVCSQKAKESVLAKRY